VKRSRDALRVTGSVGSLVFSISIVHVTIPPGSSIDVGSAVFVTTIDGGFSKMLFSNVHTTVWPKAIPQYTIGYERFLNHMKDIEANYPGIHFAGHYRDGISVSNSLLSGLNIAKRIAS